MSRRSWRSRRRLSSCARWGLARSTSRRARFSALGNGPNCVYILDPSAPSAMLANGNVNIQSNCGVLVDSSSNTGLTLNGNISMSAPTIGVVGNYLANGNVTTNPTPKTGMIAAPDPLAYIQEPSVGACNHSNFLLNGNIGTHAAPYQMSPGVYCGGILLNGNIYANFNAERTSSPAAE